MRSALRLVWALDVKHLLSHKTRLALSALGIAVGVSLAVGVGSLATSITSSLEAVATAAASDANLEVRPNGSSVGLDPELLGAVRQAEGVKAAGATIESYVKIRSDSAQVRTLAIGVDQQILRMSPRAVGSSGPLSADVLSGLWLPPSIASQLDVVAGSEVEVTAPTGWKKTPVTLVFGDEQASSRVVVSTVGTMQDLLGRGDTYDAIYVQSEDPEAGLEHLRRAIGDAANVGPVAFQGEQIRQLLASANASFSVGTIVALFVGAFLVYNTMAMAAVERLREAALLRAVGARRRQVFALFVAEGGMLGMIGSIAGVGIGLVLSAQILRLQAGAIEEIYPISISNLEVDSIVLAGSAVAGVAAALAASILPARRIARADVAPALGPAAALEDSTKPKRRWVTFAGTLLTAAGAATSVVSLGGTSEASAVTMIGLAMTLAGIALVIPVLIPAIAAVCLGFLTRIRRLPLTPRLAAGEVLRSPGRTSYTVGAVLLSLALVVAFSIAQSSITKAFDEGFDDIISADIYVRSATWRPFGSDVPVDHKLAREMERLDGVRGVWPFRIMPITYEGRSVVLLAYELETFAEHTRVSASARSVFREDARAAAGKKAIIASSSLLAQRDIQVGDVISLPTPTGVQELEVAGSFDDPAAVTPEMIIDHEVFRDIWGAGGADSFGVRVEDLDEREEVMRSIEEAFGEELGLTVSTREEYLEELSGAVDAIVGLITSVQLVAVIVAALGLANTLLISTFERRRDLGVLRAIGTTRKQIRRMVALEAVFIASLGVACAWVLGTVIGLGMFLLVRAQLGIPIQPAFPPLAYLAAAALGLVSAVAASAYPADRAAKVQVVEALAYE